MEIDYDRPATSQPAAVAKYLELEADWEAAYLLTLRAAWMAVDPERITDDRLTDPVGPGAVVSHRSAAQLLGLGEAMLAQATDYAKLRHQFGQPIGAFQALKHQLANVSVALAFARPVLLRAAQSASDGAA